MTTLRRETALGVGLSQLKILQIRELGWTMCPPPNTNSCAPLWWSLGPIKNLN